MLHLNCKANTNLKVLRKWLDSSKCIPAHYDLILANLRKIQLPKVQLPFDYYTSRGSYMDITVELAKDRSLEVRCKHHVKGRCYCHLRRMHKDCKASKRFEALPNRLVAYVLEVEALLGSRRAKEYKRCYFCNGHPNRAQAWSLWSF